MLLVDDILLSPFNGLIWLFKEIQKQAQSELDSEAETVTQALSELYMRLDTGQITEEEFAAEEKILLDRLDAIWERNHSGDEDSDEEYDEDSDEDDESAQDADDEDADDGDAEGP